LNYTGRSVAGRLLSNLPRARLSFHDGPAYRAADSARHRQPRRTNQSRATCGRRHPADVPITASRAATRGEAEFRLQATFDDAARTRFGFDCNAGALSGPIAIVSSGAKIACIVSEHEQSVRDRGPYLRVASRQSPAGLDQALSNKSARRAFTMNLNSARAPIRPSTTSRSTAGAYGRIGPNSTAIAQSGRRFSVVRKVGRHKQPEGGALGGRAVSVTMRATSL